MIHKTPAIVLRWYPFSNTSRVVSWLTPEHGKIVTMVKGSQRPKSAFLGQYDLFYTCELVFYARERTGMHIARECSPLKIRNRLRTDWKACAAASYLCDLLSRASPPDAPHAGLFELLDEGLDHLAPRASGQAPPGNGLSPNGSTMPFVFWFELKLLETLGFAPRLRQCLDCKKELAPGTRNTRFQYSHGGILCSRCSEREHSDSVPISPAVLAMLAAWQRARDPRAAFSTQCTAGQLKETERLLELFLTYHLDTSLASRRIALEVMRRDRERRTSNIERPTSKS
jgi:DNA repair protein RecO (recombination protein O)